MTLQVDQDALIIYSELFCFIFQDNSKYYISMQKTPYATYESFYNNDFPLIANLKDFNIHNLIYFLFIIFIIYAIAEVGYSYKSFIIF